MLKSRIRTFLAERSGNIAITFAVSILPIIFLTGLAIDYGEIQRERSHMQDNADAAALYAAKQLENAGYTENDLSDDADDVVASNFDIDGAVEVDLAKGLNRLTVTLTKQYQPTFLALLHPEPVTINVLAEVAYQEVFEGAKCFMSLSETGKGVLNLNGNSVVNAEDCAVQVNSSSSDAVDLNGSGTELISASNCFVGGVQSGLSRIQPPPEEECAVMPDPFDEYEVPAVGACDYSSFKVNANKTVTIDPGVYCDGISIGSGANVTFNPGLYTIKDGQFKSTGSSVLTGDGVTFYFADDDVAVNFSGGTTFHFVAMDTGVLAGFLFFFDPDADITWTSEFSGNSSTYFEGILYFGRRDLKVNGEGEVNTGSPLSVVIADTITLDGNATINFNVDADNTDLPIPEELYEKTITPYLVR